MTVVPAYAALLALLFVWLSLRVIGVRRSQKVGLGVGGNRIVERAMRVHGNFAEYAPLALLLLAFLEIRQPHVLLLHGLCAALLIGRALHAWGVSREPEDFRIRVAGMATTFTVIIAAALANLWMSLAG